MKRSSVNRYFYSVSIYDTITSRIRITEEQYKQQLKELLEQTEAHLMDECPTEHRSRVFEKDSMTITMHTFTCTTSDITLEHLQCHDGYQFVTAKNKRQPLSR